MKIWLAIIVAILFCPIIPSTANLAGPSYSLEADNVISAESSPIVISNDADLLMFPGNGTFEDPYRIEGYSISNTGNLPSISISNTTSWILIQNCTFSNTSSAAIDLYLLQNVIVRNISSFNTVNGIRLNNVVNVSVVSSKVQDCDLGVSVINSEQCQILNNTIVEGSAGIHLSGAIKTRVSHNYIQDMSSQGIYIDDTLNLIDNNTLVNTTVGIELRTANSNMIYQNALLNCSYGVFSMDSMYCDISNNTFVDNEYGVYLYQGNAGYSISWNAFYPSGSLTVFDDMPENHFFYNFYWDYTGIDSDNDGIGDSPYQIAGSGNNQDMTPLMSPPGSIRNDTTPPKIYWFPTTEKVEYGQEVSVNPTIIDVNGVISAILSFSNGSEQWFNISMVSVGIKWLAVIPAHFVDVVIKYRIYSCDGRGNWGVSEDWSYSVVPDAYSPVVTDKEIIENFVTINTNSESFDSHTFAADVYDESDIAYVIVHYRFKEHLTTFDNGTLALNYDILSNTWSATVHFPKPVNRYTAIFQYEAADVYGNIGLSFPYEITYLARTESVTTPGPSPIFSISMVSLVITSAIIAVILFKELKERAR